MYDSQQTAQFSFIHLENLHSTLSRTPLLRGDPSPTTVIKTGFEQLAEQGYN